MLKYLGICALLWGLIGVYSSYRAYTERRLSELSAFVKLICGIKEEIEVYSRPLGTYLSSFRDGAFDAVGVDFSSKDAKEAYERSKDALAIGAVADDILSSFFSSLGSSGREGEIAKCEYAIDKLRVIEEEERASLAKNRVSLGAITAAVGLSVTILII